MFMLKKLAHLALSNFFQFAVVILFCTMSSLPILKSMAQVYLSSDNQSILFFYARTMPAQFFPTFDQSLKFSNFAHFCLKVSQLRGHKSCLFLNCNANSVQWNAEIRTSEIQTMPKSTLFCVRFPDLRISDIWAVRFFWSFSLISYVYNRTKIVQF